MKYIYIFILLILTYSCTQVQSNLWSNVKPVQYKLPDNPINNGSRIKMGRMSFYFPFTDTSGCIKINDTSVIYKCSDSIKLIVFKQDNSYLLNKAKKQAEQNIKLYEVIKEFDFKNDFELYKYIYHAQPNQEVINNELLIDLKNIILPIGSENGIYELSNSKLKGFQYCVGVKCKTISYDVFIDEFSYKVIANGMNQEILDRIIGSFEISAAGAGL